MLVTGQSCCGFLQDGAPDISANVAALDGAVLLSIVTRRELDRGVYRDADDRLIGRARLDAILEGMPFLVFRLGGGGLIATQTARPNDRGSGPGAPARFVTLNGSDIQDVPNHSLLEW